MRLAAQREALIRQLIAEGYLKTAPVIRAFRTVTRELFVSEKDAAYAYSDYPLSIGSGQTISAPHMVAMMTELLEPKRTDIVLEVGAGSGYQAAVLSGLVKRVYTIELEQELSQTAKGNLKKAGIKNVDVLIGDGSQGLPGHAPYDRIIVTCGCPEIPEPLIGQLKINGRMVIPVGGQWQQELLLVIKKKTHRPGEYRLEKKNYGSCVFVPLRK